MQGQPGNVASRCAVLASAAMTLDELFAQPSIARQRERLLELLRALSFQEREVVLASGQRSNFYIDCRRVSLDAEGHFLIGQLLRAVIDVVAPEARAIGGMTLGADPLVSATSTISFMAGRPLDGFLVRKEAKGHGTGQYLETGGRLAAGTASVIVEDTVTTGGSLLRALERARDAGLRPVHALAIVDRLEGGREAIEAQVPLTALYTRKDFLP
jgi:orotate phosphoribosyltransferase